MLKNEGKKDMGIVYILRKIYPMCFKAKPSYFIYIHALCILEALITGLGVYVNQIFFDSVYSASLGISTTYIVFTSLLTFACVKILSEIIESMKNFSVDTNIIRILVYMNNKIAKKCSQIDPMQYEDANRLDDIYKATVGAGSAVHFQFTFSMIITFYIPYFTFMSFYLFSLQPLLILAILFVFVPTVISQILRSSIFTKLVDETAPLNRKYEAFRSAIIDIKNIKETRNLGAFQYFKKLLIDTRVALNKRIWKANLKSNKIEAFLKLLSLVGYVGVLFLLIYYLLNGSISVGAFAALYGSIGTVFAIMEGMIRWDIGYLSEHFGPIRNFLRFLEIPETKRENIDINKRGDIVVQNVSFRYPNANQDCLSGINLTIRGGETVAIVGENGAGKTTLIRILMGLYQPSVGNVLIDGVDIATVDYSYLFKNVSGVFQKFQRYMFTLKDNIKISDYRSNADIDEAILKGGIDITDADTFPMGVETMLSREYDGVDISGGEWQRVAIARGFYRNSDIIFLDEPTAAIDPIEESSIYRRFRAIAKDKTAVIITHRLGSARIADRILVMQNGKIVQSGTHDNLLEVDGVYKDMFTSQSNWYNENDDRKTGSSDLMKTK